MRTENSGLILAYDPLASAALLEASYEFYRVGDERLP